MSGGNDRGTYYAGLGYNRQEGVPVNTFYERYSFITNASYKIADWLTSTSSLNYNRANWKNMPGSNGSGLNYFGRVRSLPPTVLFEEVRVPLMVTKCTNPTNGGMTIKAISSQ